MKCSLYFRRLSQICVVSVLGMGVVAAPTLTYGQALETWNQPCQKLLKQYKSAPGHKAFSVSNISSGSGGGQSCGAAWGARSKKEAEAAAIKQCRMNVAGSCGINRSE